MKRKRTIKVDGTLHLNAWSIITDRVSSAITYGLNRVDKYARDGDELTPSQRDSLEEHLSLSVLNELGELFKWDDE